MEDRLMEEYRQSLPEGFWLIGRDRSYIIDK